MTVFKMHYIMQIKDMSYYETAFYLRYKERYVRINRRPRIRKIMTPIGALPHYVSIRHKKTKDSRYIRKRRLSRVRRKLNLEKILRKC